MVRTSAYCKRGTGKWTNNRHGGVLYEKAKFRRTRTRAALKHSGNDEGAIPLGRSGKREGSKRGPGVTVDMPSEISGRGKASQHEEAELVSSLIVAGSKVAAEAVRASEKRDAEIKNTRKRPCGSVAPPAPPSSKSGSKRRG